MKNGVNHTNGFHELTKDCNKLILIFNLVLQNQTNQANQPIHKIDEAKISKFGLRTKRKVNYSEKQMIADYENCSSSSEYHIEKPKRYNNH